ncbi:MAG: 23S rRNA (adenine(2503)-C(2))-methyltransferase RlmN, partial [Planctomycetota bacterium]
MSSRSDRTSETACPWLGLTAAEGRTRVDDWHMPTYRAKQINQWVFDRSCTQPERMNNLPAALRDRLSDQFEPTTLLSHQHSTDGTRKFLFGWSDGQSAETVMIPDDGGAKPRRTACISSQVGCPVGCRFCASGQNGKLGDLTASRIVEQVVRVNTELAAEGGRLTNLVFMGMGEPLANYGEVTRALRVLTDPGCLGMSPRRITVSTVGVPRRIRQLADEEWPINLALSLHAPNESLRRELIPWADHFELGDILDACRYYFEQTRREITFEYILLRDVNDRREHAAELADICQAMRCNVNLLRYNEVEGIEYVRPRSPDVMAFQSELRRRGVNAHVRKSRGRDIDAACGQLRKKQERAAE